MYYIDEKLYLLLFSQIVYDFVSNLEGNK